MIATKHHNSIGTAVGKTPCLEISASNRGHHCDRRPHSSNSPAVPVGGRAFIPPMMEGPADGSQRPATDNNGQQRTLDAAVPTPPDFELAARLQVVICRQCGIYFAVPTSFYLARAIANDTIVCPAGHAQKFGRGDAATGGGWPAKHLAALEEIAQLRRSLQLALAELETIAPTAAASKQGEPMGAAEIKKRAYMLAARAEAVPPCRGICTFCGKPSSSLRRHLINAHKDKIAAMPAALFG